MDTGGLPGEEEIRKYQFSGKVTIKEYQIFIQVTQKNPPIYRKVGRADCRNEFPNTL